MGLTFIKITVTCPLSDPKQIAWAWWQARAVTGARKQMRSEATMYTTTSGHD